MALDVLVVGAGIFGVTGALELRARGHAVALLEPGPVPHPDAASTDVSKMVRMDYGADVFYHEMAEAALDGWDAWNDAWPRPLYHETGFLVLTGAPMEPGGFEHESLRVLRARGYDPPALDAPALARRHPAWNADAHPDGYLSPRGGWVESGEVVAQLAALCRESGVALRRGRLAEPLQRGGRVVGARTEAGDEILADVVLVCAGAWTPHLLPGLTDVMWATAQQVVHLQPRDANAFRPPAFPPFAADIARAGWYGFPALPDGRVKIAHHGPGRRTHPSRAGEVGDAHVDRVRRFLATALPGLADAPVVVRRVCCYCDTFDGDFWIDHDPDRPGLVVAAGGSGHAFKFAPLLGAIVADVVERRPNRWAGRFAWRRPGPARAEAARAPRSHHNPDGTEP